MSNKFQIRVHSGALRGQAFVINKPEFKVGRDPSCDIVLTENSVSRVHLLIYSQDFNHIVLVDNNSTNGTTVNNTPVTAPLQIFENDVIMLGGEVALALESLPEVQNPYAPYSQPSVSSVPEQAYNPASNIPPYQPPVDPAAAGNSLAGGNYEGSPEKPFNGYNQQAIPTPNQLEEKRMVNSQNSDPNQNIPGQSFPGQQYPDPQNPYAQYPAQQPYPGYPNQPYSQSGYPQQPYPGQPAGNMATPYGVSQNPSSQYPAAQGPSFQQPGMEPSAGGMYQQQFQQSQYPQTPAQAPYDPKFAAQQQPVQQPYGQQQPWGTSQQNPYGGQGWPQQPDPAYQQQGGWQSQPNQPGQQYQQQGYPYNPQQQGYGQPEGQPYGAYPGYQQDYGNVGYPQEYQTDDEANRRKKLYIILGAVLLFIIALIVFIIIIDSNYLWCDVFPFLWSPEACAIYSRP
mgnify:CR=1 FL=1